MRFFIITACRNSSYIERCINSVKNQKNEHWNMVVIDDDSNDDTFQKATQAKLNDERIKIIQNYERKYALQNIVESIWKFTAEDDVIVLLDGDDYLIDSRVLDDIESEYIKTGADALWTQHQNSDGTEGNSGPIQGNPLFCSWRMSHLRTFKKHLIHGIKPETFVDEKGEWFKCAYDQALYRPVLYLAKHPVFYNRVAMVYNLGQGDNQPEIQKQTALKIQNNLKKEFQNKNPRNVLLIVNGKSEGCDKRFHQGERRHPLGVLTIAASLKARGHDVRLFDRFASPEYWNEKDVEWADVVGVSCTTPNFADALKCLKDLQKYRGEKLIIAGGAHCILHPEQVKPYADLVSISEADFEIIDMVEKGIVSDKQIRITNLDSTPLPDYELALNQIWEYTDNWDYDNSTGILPMNTSRSCPHACAFCDVKNIWGRKWVAKSAERVIEDALYLKRTFNINAIYFREDNFCCNESRLRDICYGLIGKGIKWACEMRADSAQDSELLELMAKAGCVGIYIGAESGSNKMLEIYKKGITREQIIQACNNANAAGINILMSIIEKHPEETEKDIEATKEMIKICKPKKVNRCDYRKPE